MAQDVPAWTLGERVRRCIGDEVSPPLGYGDLMAQLSARNTGDVPCTELHRGGCRAAPMGFGFLGRQRGHTPILDWSMADKERCLDRSTRSQTPRGQRAWSSERSGCLPCPCPCLLPAPLIHDLLSEGCLQTLSTLAPELNSMSGSLHPHAGGEGAEEPWGMSSVPTSRPRLDWHCQLTG